MLFSLGPTPLVNRFISEAQIPSEKLYDLTLVRCEHCKLVQLQTTVPPAELYSDYQHLSSASKTNLAHLDGVAETVGRLFGGGEAPEGKKLLEIGCNDGSLLLRLKPHFERVMGVDPAQNLRALSTQHNVPIVSDFFSLPLAEQIREQHGLFDVLVGLNVVPHTEDFMGLLRGVARLLEPDGRFVFEFAYVVDTIVEGDFDTIYHEHIYNFSMTSISNALQRAGLVAVDVERLPTQGGSLRVTAALARPGVYVAPSVGQLLERERVRGDNDAERYEPIRRRLPGFKARLVETLVNLKAAGKTLVALGAPARGVVVLNYCGIGPDLLDFAIDDTPLKQGKLMPGVHVPVRDWSALESVGDDVAFLLVSWNYREEILRKLSRFRSDGTLVEYFPEYRVSELGR